MATLSPFALTVVYQKISATRSPLRRRNYAPRFTWLSIPIPRHIVFEFGGRRQMLTLTASVRRFFHLPYFTDDWNAWPVSLANATGGPAPVFARLTRTTPAQIQERATGGLSGLAGPL